MRQARHRRRDDNDDVHHDVTKGAKKSAEPEFFVSS
jgi:hypothetical protein